MSNKKRSTEDHWRSLGVLLGFGVLILIVLAVGVPASAAPDGQGPADPAAGAGPSNPTAVDASSDNQSGSGGVGPKETVRLPKDKKITQQDREAAAKKVKGKYEESLLTQMAIPDPGGVPHYYGPWANWANSPMPKGPVFNVTVENGGSGYTAPTVQIVDVYETNTSEATATATVVGGVITEIVMVTHGADYTAPRVIINDTTGTGAIATANLDPAQLTGGIRKFVSTADPIPIAVPDKTSFPMGGRGYTSAPTVVVTDSNGTGAVATANVVGDRVDSVTIVNGGSSYTDRPVVTFVGGGVDGASGVGANAIGKATVTNGVITGITLVPADYYVIELDDFQEQMHPDLPPTTIRGYRQVNTNDPAASAFNYLGVAIVAERDIPVRIRFINSLPPGNGGNLSIPVDTTVMGAGHGANGGTELYTQNRATLHLHGGFTPWISDGTPFQWTVPVGDTTTSYPQGVSVYNVPDMPDWGPNPQTGVLTFYYTNQQSARLQFYHDHSHGITRLNVYAGEAAPYLITDQVERDMAQGTDQTGVNPARMSVLPPDNGGLGIPLVLQDKTFVDASTIYAQDPTWNWGTTPGMARTGDLWYPHVYVPAQNPWAPDGVNPFGRWPYGPWFWPPPNVPYGPVANPYYATNDLEVAQEIPGVPNPSMAMEAFMDTSIVNGEAYPYLTVEPRAYRFRILNAADDRFYNLQLYRGNTSDYLTTDGYPTEVSMVPASPNTGLPANWPTDGRDGGVPDPATAGPNWIVIGTEGGFLPAPVEVPSQPITWVNDPTVFNAGNVDQFSLLVAPAERADVVVNFSQFAGQTLILYNDAPAAFPAIDGRYDYYTGHPDMTDTGGAPTTQAGFGPNTRTVMQIRVLPSASTPTPDVSLDKLKSVFANTTGKRGVFEVSQDPIISTQAGYNSAYNGTFPADNYVRIHQTSYTFDTLAGNTVTIPITSKAIQDEQGEAFDEYGRLSGFLGLQATNARGQTTLLLYGYESPPVDILSDVVGKKIGETGDGTAIWKITHNGVDTHPIHWHLVNVQVINRVGWDGIIRAPDPTELGWKETLRVSPLEDTIVAMRATTPWLPFDLPNSYRPIDPTEPPDAPLFGSPGSQPQFQDMAGNPVSVTNKVLNYGWEYVFHCHILAHEEMDMMHALLFATPPKAPTNLTVTDLGGNRGLLLNWRDNSAGETGFTIERATDPAFTTGVVIGTVGQNEASYTDTTVDKRVVYYYRVTANNMVGDTTVYPAPAVGFAKKQVNSVPSNVASVGGTVIVTPTPVVPPAAPLNVVATARLSGTRNSRITLTWTDNSNVETGYRIQYALNSGFTSGSVISEVAPNTQTWTSPNLLRRTDYWVRVQAFNAGGNSTWVNASPFPIRTP